MAKWDFEELQIQNAHIHDLSVVEKSYCITVEEVGEKYDIQQLKI